MPKIAKELSPAEVRRLMTKPGLHSVGGVKGLQLQVGPRRNRQHACSWVLRVKYGGRRRDIGLGSFPSVDLKGARTRAREARDQIDQGIDPLEERRKRAATLQAIEDAKAARLTFAEAAERVHRIKAQEFGNGKHSDQWLATIEQHANPKIGRIDVADVDFHAVLRCLEPIWATRTATATRLRGRIESVLAWAKVNGFRSGDNPARWKGNLDAALPKPGAVGKGENHPALPFVQMPQFMVDLAAREGTAAKALAFAILTAARSGEVRGARWSEIDLDEKLWTVPASRMKAKRDHRVPLSPAAVAVLTTMQSNRDPSELVFPAPRGGMLSDMTLKAVVNRMHAAAVKAGGVGWVDPKLGGRVATPHGFRSAFKDWASEATHHQFEIAEAALAHIVGDRTEAAYRRGDLFDKRRQLMADWAKFCVGGGTRQKK